jgi:hypothetical protein
VVVSFVSIPIESGAIEGTGTAAQLISINDNSGALVMANLLRGLGLLLLIPPLYYLFEAARARSPAVRGALVGFVFLGPILFAAQGVASGIVTTNVASDYVDRQDELTVQAPPAKTFLKEAKANPDSFEQAVFYTDENGFDVERRGGEVFSIENLGGGSCPAPTSGDESCLSAVEDQVSARGIDTSEDTDGKPGDLAAENLIDDSSARSTVSGFLFPALLAMIVALVYTSLQAMRVGLLTRFFGTLGMAIGVSVLFIGLVGLLLWILALGFLILGRWPGGAPPAWAAGEAVPWLPAGEAPPKGGAGDEAIEGEAVEAGAGANGGNAARRERARKRKRKRRR